MNLAVLITSYNRYDITKKCIARLRLSNLTENVKMDIYLTDDNSPDQTGRKIQCEFPEVHVIQGTGELYWNQGMRLAWLHASSVEDYDFYLWLNDDTLVFKNSIQDCLNVIWAMDDKSILVGACEDNSGQLTYGGRDENFILIEPNGKLQPCTYMNGNFVMIPKKIFKEIGILDENFLHGFGDYDYGLTALKKGIQLLVFRTKVGTCEGNNSHNFSTKVLERFKNLNNPKNIRLVDLYYFKKKHFGKWSASFSILKLILKTASPSFYARIKYLINPK